MYTRLRQHLILTSCLFVFFIIIGVFLEPVIGIETTANLRKAFSPITSYGPVLLFIFIFINNSLKALGVILTGMFAGIPPLLLIAVNGIVLGTIATVAGEQNGSVYVIAGLVPHGIFEIPAMILSTSLGCLIGREALCWALRKQHHILSTYKESLRLYALVVLPAIAIAALLEVTITPCVLRLITS
jgi:stage II sporulation protein M